MVRTALVLSSLFLSAAAWAGPAEGFYVTIDDNTNAPYGLVELVETPDGRLEGFTRGSFVIDPSRSQLCTACKGEMKDQPIIGLRFLRDLEPRDGKPLKWRRGRITDPDTGQTFKSKLTFAEDYSEVKVRGYIGTPALGRSQVWIRATDAEIEQINQINAERGYDLARPPASEAN